MRRQSSVKEHKGASNRRAHHGQSQQRGSHHAFETLLDIAAIDRTADRRGGVLAADGDFFVTAYLLTAPAITGRWTRAPTF
jgi:hypothetical protein